MIVGQGYARHRSYDAGKALRDINKRRARRLSMRVYGRYTRTQSRIGVLSHGRERLTLWSRLLRYIRGGADGDPAAAVAVKPGVLRLAVMALGGVLLLCALAVVIVPAVANAGRMTVSLDIDGSLASVDTFDETVGDLLSRYDIVLREGDVLYPTASEALTEGMQISIRRAITVSVEYDGQLHYIRTLSGTVEDALRRAGISYTDEDVLNYPVTSRLMPGMNIDVTKMETEHEFVTEVMPFRIKYQDDNSLLKGEEEIVQRGIEGSKELQYRITYRDGEEVSKQLIGERVLSAPRARIVAVGTKVATPKPKATPKPTPKPTKKPSTTASSVTAHSIKVDGKEYSYSETMSVTVTAYTHTGNKTATGKWPKVGMVAVDKSIIPLGTKLYVPGYGICVAQDVGVRGKQVDIFLDTYEECIQWGRKRNVKIHILSD